MSDSVTTSFELESRERLCHHCAMPANAWSSDDSWQRYECGSEKNPDGFGKFHQTAACSELAALRQRLEEIESELITYKTNGGCPSCHKPLEGVGYIGSWIESDPEVVFECGCGCQWKRTPGLRRKEFLESGVSAALAASLSPPAEPTQGGER
jgi:hypothetical protein